MSEQRRNTPKKEEKDKDVTKQRLSGSNEKPDNSQNVKKIGRLQSILQYAYNCSADSFKKMLFSCYCAIAGMAQDEKNCSDNSIVNNYLKAFSNNTDELIKLFVLICNNRTSFGDSIWYCLNEYIPPAQVTDYESFYVAKTHHGQTTINSSYCVRKAFRAEMIPNIRDKPLQNPPIYSKLNSHVLKELNEVRETQVEPNFLMSIEMSDLNDLSAGFVNANLQFCNYFVKYIKSPDRSWDEVEFLIEELVDCLYFQLDQTALKTFTSMRGAQAGNSIHRALRFFMINCPISFLSQFMLKLANSDARLNKEIQLNLHLDDRCYFDDGKMKLTGGHVDYRSLVEFNPFTVEFGVKLQRRELASQYGLFEIPEEEDAIQEEVDDELVKYINEDAHFRNITKRQLTDWCPIGNGYNGHFPYGFWEKTYDVKVVSEFNNFHEEKKALLEEILKADEEKPDGVTDHMERFK